MAVGITVQGEQRGLVHRGGILDTHCERVEKLPLFWLTLIGFLCKTRLDRSSKKRGSPYVDEPPSWSDADDSLEPMSDSDGEDNLPDDKDLSPYGVDDEVWGNVRRRRMTFRCG